MSLSWVFDDCPPKEKELERAIYLSREGAIHRSRLYEQMAGEPEREDGLILKVPLRSDIVKEIKELERFLKCKKHNSWDKEQARKYPIGELLGRQPDFENNNVAKYTCPLHNEKTASFQWYKGNNSYYCFGCGKGGDVIDLCMKIKRVNFVDALRFLS